MKKKKLFKTIVFKKRGSTGYKKKRNGSKKVIKIKKIEKKGNCWKERKADISSISQLAVIRKIMKSYVGQTSKIGRHRNPEFVQLIE